MSSDLSVSSRGVRADGSCDVIALWWRGLKHSRVVVTGSVKWGYVMSNAMVRVLLLSSPALVSLCCLGGAGSAQTPGTPPAPETPQAQPQPAPSTPGTLPTINVETTKKKPAKKQAARRPP